MGMMIKLIGASKLRNVLSSKGTIQGPMRKGISKITLKYEGLVKKATVIDTGRLASSITHRITSRSGIVGTNVKYASFVEYGHKTRSGSFVEARHREGGRPRVLGMGMFTFALTQLNKWLGREEGEIARDIEGKFKP